MATFEMEIATFLGTESMRDLNTGHTALVKKLNWGYAKIQAQLDEKQRKDTTSTHTVMESVLVVFKNNV